MGKLEDNFESDLRNKKLTELTQQLQSLDSDLQTAWR